MKNQCSRWEKLLERFHDGELSRAERARVEEHLAGCAGCSAQLQRLERLGRLAALPAAEALSRVPEARMDALWTRVAARLKEEPPLSWSERLAQALGLFWGEHHRTILAAAGAACLTLLIAWPLLRHTDDQGSGGAGQSDGASGFAAASGVIVDSVQSGEHDMVLVNVHPEDMTTVIWLLNDGENGTGKAGRQAASGTAPGTGSGTAANPAAAPPATGAGTETGSGTGTGTETGSGTGTGTSPAPGAVPAAGAPAAAAPGAAGPAR